ncbi:MAG: hypothetical protein H0S85_15155 [Desulfovibrionaceae bacterium]|jgi:hypothetical protein|nr:hypothetical protein [Desulfovibrionaceae bacterium]
MERLKGMSREQMWDAVERLASISHSVASNGQRQLHKAFEAVRATTGASLDVSGDVPRAEVPTVQAPEAASGALLDDVG